MRYQCFSFFGTNYLLTTVTRVEIAFFKVSITLHNIIYNKINTSKVGRLLAGWYLISSNNCSENNNTVIKSPNHNVSKI